MGCNAAFQLLCIQLGHTDPHTIACTCVVGKLCVNLGKEKVMMMMMMMMMMFVCACVRVRVCVCVCVDVMNVMNVGGNALDP